MICLFTYIKYKYLKTFIILGCPKLDEVSFVLDPASNSFHAPDTVVVRCAEGYLFGGGFKGESSVTLNCQGDGSWNLHNLPFCERK